MKTAGKVAGTVARLMQRDQEFEVLDNSIRQQPEGNRVIPMAALAEWMGYTADDPKLSHAISRARIAVMKAGHKAADHFLDADLFDGSQGLYVSLHAALMIIINADPEKSLVAKAQNFFASRASAEVQEGEKRLKSRYEVAEETKRLNSSAKNAGVENFGKFTAYGYRGMYGGRNIDDVARMKNLKNGSEVLDFAGSEELAAHLFRITQTKAKLDRDGCVGETHACATHAQVGGMVRAAIMRMGGTMPELLPPAQDKIDAVETVTRKRLDQAGH